MKKIQPLTQTFPKIGFNIRNAFTAAAIALFAACASAPPTPQNPSDAAPEAQSSLDVEKYGTGASAINQDRLRALWEKRSHLAAVTDYPIGPGDVLEITVPGVADLKDITARVDGEGQIELPMLGRMDVAGLTEGQLNSHFKEALGKYMYDPQVSVFIKEYRSRQVAIVGAVRSPGLITLSGSGETILDAISRAGGMAPDAADEVVILPEVKGGAVKLREIATSMETAHPAGARVDGQSPAADPKATTSADALHGTPNQPPPPSTPITMASLEQDVSNGPAVVIPLKNRSLSGSVQYMNMPVEPGDVIVVPGGGIAMVTGWVQRPGFFQVGSGLTVLGVVGAAGGVMYAADPGSATLIRSDGSGNKVSLPVNLNRIAKGEDPDIPVRANDVVDIPYSDIKIGPYVVYNILSRMAVPLPVY
jgi:polysaccharide export outer membrane protein